MKIKGKEISLRPSGKSQVSTNIGVTGIFTQFLAVFSQTKLEDFIPTLKAMTIGEMFGAFAPFLLFLWSIFHNEGKKSPKRDIQNPETNINILPELKPTDMMGSDSPTVTKGINKNIKDPIYKNTGSGPIVSEPPITDRSDRGVASLHSPSQEDLREEKGATELPPDIYNTEGEVFATGGLVKEEQPVVLDITDEEIKGDLNK